MKQGYFITGTDTNAGKTCATIALMRYFKQQGKTIVGMKPVASGGIVEKGGLKNEDALLIQKNASLPLEYPLINPYLYELPVSPHIAGKNNPVKLSEIIIHYDILKKLSDIILVEGAGGWLSPLNASQDNSDLAKALALPVILIVGVRLGCINHAKLTYQSIRHSGLTCAGWIAVCLDPTMLKVDDNINTLKEALSIPLLGVLPYLEHLDFDLLAEHICI
jgi:dethiobiotin synthetase